MKILFVVWNFYPNTAYTNRSKATIRGMRECGCHVDVLSIKPLITKEDTCLNHDENTRKTFFPTLCGMVRNYYRLQCMIQNYDIIYCATSNIRIVRRCISLAYKHRKVVVHERTEMPDIFYDKSKKNQKGLSAYLKETQRFDHLFVISNPIKNYFVESGIPDTKISIFPMIVDPDRFAKLKKNNWDYKYIAYCGNLSNSKDGVADLIEAYGRSETKKTHKLMLIGANPSKNEKELYDILIRKYNIEEQVIFRGNVTREDMPQILMDADTLLLCRPNNRQALGGFPTKLGEYLATGNPVLVTRVGDINLYIRDGRNGYLAKPNDIDDFRFKLDSIIADYDKAKKVGVYGKELTNDAFNYSVQTQKVVAVLKTLL